MKGFVLIALSLVFLALGAVLVAPIAQFIYEEYSNPKMLYIDISYSSYNQTHLKLLLKAEYNGTVPLNDLRLRIWVGNKVSETHIGTVTGGQKFDTKIVLSAVEAQSSPTIKVDIEFVLAGIYPIEISVTRS